MLNKLFGWLFYTEVRHLFVSDGNMIIEWNLWQRTLKHVDTRKAWKVTSLCLQGVLSLIIPSQDLLSMELLEAFTTLGLWCPLSFTDKHIGDGTVTIFINICQLSLHMAASRHPVRAFCSKSVYSLFINLLLLRLTQTFCATEFLFLFIAFCCNCSSSLSDTILSHHMLSVLIKPGQLSHHTYLLVPRLSDNAGYSRRDVNFFVL